MRHLSRGTSWLALATILAAVAASGPALAQDPGFQTFFFSACGTATGDLATRCSETPSNGDLSGDSESSLNPNQILSGLDASLNRAQERSGGIQDLLDEQRGDDPARAQHDRQIAAVTERLSFILTGRGTWYSRDATAVPTPTTTIGERGFEGTIAGLGAGFDYRFSDRLVLGALFNWDRADGTFDPDLPGVNFTPQANEGTRQSDAFIFSAIGSYSFDKGFFIDGHLGGGPIRYDFRRNVVFQDSGRTGQVDVNTFADVDGSELSVSGGVGWDTSWRALSGGLYARARYIINWIDAYEESGGSGLAMAFPKESRESLATVIGLRGSYAISTGIGVIVPQARVEWEHEFKRDGLVTTSTYLSDPGGNTFGVVGDDPTRDYVNVGAGVAMVLRSGFIPFIDYQGLFAYSDWSRHRLTGGLRKEF